MFKYRLLRAAKILLVVAVVVSALSWIVMSLWNALLPGLFGWRVISFGQALGLLVLSRILLGGFRPGFGGPPWRRHMAERWSQMTPEEREKFREGLRQRCWSRGGKVE